MITSGDDVVAIVSGMCRTGGLRAFPTPCCVLFVSMGFMQSETSSQHSAFGKSSAIASPIFRLTAASLLMSSQSATTQAFGSKARGLLDIYQPLASAEDQKPLLCKSFGQNEDFVKYIKQVIMSSALAFAGALKAVFDDSASWRTELEESHFKSSALWNDALQRYWSEKMPLQRLATSQSTGKGATSFVWPTRLSRTTTLFLWRAMKIGAYRFFLKKNMWDFTCVCVCIA